MVRSVVLSISNLNVLSLYYIQLCNHFVRCSKLVAAPFASSIATFGSWNPFSAPLSSKRRYLSSSPLNSIKGSPDILTLLTEFHQSSSAEQLKILDSMRLNKVVANQSPFEWLKGLPGYSSLKRQRPRRLANVLFPRRLDRDEAMGICYGYFDDLLRQYDLPGPRALRVPIIAISAAPGSGKTFFLDEVGELRPADVDLFCQSKWAPALKSAVTIKLSFNGFSNILDPAVDRDNIALCTRMLYSYFHSILPPEMTFTPFFLQCLTLNMTTVKPATCIQFIVSHFVSTQAGNYASQSCDSTEVVPSPSSSGPVLVLLMVDELAKSNCEDKIIAAVGSILDESPRLADGRKCLVLPVFTSLHETKLTDLLTGSQRAIKKVPLRVALTSAPAAMKALLAAPPELHPLIDVLCNDVGCHGRMLEAIADLLHPTTKLWRDVNVFDHDPFRMLPLVHAALFDHPCSAEFFRDLSQAPHVLINVVCTVLLGLTVVRKLPVAPGQQHDVSASKVIGQLPMSQWTYDYLLSQGVFIADAGKSLNDITPVMSPLQLVKWADSMQRISFLELTPQMKLFLKSIKQAFSASSVHNWENFEEFHHDIEFIRRFALRRLGVCEMTPIEYFKLDDSGEAIAKALPKTPAACLQTKMDIGVDSELSRAKDKILDVSQAIVTRPQSGSTIELAVKDQELYDIRIIQPTLNKKQVLNIFEQLKWSTDPSQNDDEVRKWMEKVQSLKISNVALNDAVFVYIAARRIRDLQNKDDIHPANVIVLGQESLAHLYGPTVMGAHAMVATLARAEKATQQRAASLTLAGLVKVAGSK